MQAVAEDGYYIPEPSTYGNYFGQFKSHMTKFLHWQLAEYARREGISKNQYFLYLLTKYDIAHSVERS